MNTKRVIVAVTATVVVAFIAGCAGFGAYPPTTFGLVYTEYSGPSGHDFDNNVGMLKVGKACASNILGIVATGDASIEAAKKNGDIKKIAHIDYTSKNIILVYAQYCTVVYGE